ncbi:MAG TPA: ATP-binding protein [Bacillota bacterium]|nr:ATP-binding protein [Bacillota bacterium]
MDGLDESWLERGLLKRKSNFSSVVLVETTDPKRLQQLRDAVRERPELRGAEHVFLYDQWQGLSRLDPQTGQQTPYSKSGGDSPLQRRATAGGGSGDQAALAALKSALREVDPFLRKWQTILIIQNLAENREWETGLQGALRSWAIDADIVARGSTIFVQTADSSGLLDSFTRELVVVLTVDPSSGAERRAIIQRTGAELEVQTPPGQIGEMVMATAGLNLHQLESVLLESYHTVHTFEPGLLKELKADLVRKSGVLEVADPKFGFADIGGYEVVKAFVRRAVIDVLHDQERAARFGLPLPKGVLLFGPPGTGKSLFANALATEVRLPFIHLQTENIYSKWFGESGQNMRNALRLADKMSPAVVFIDEIDRFGRRSGAMRDSAGEESQRVFSQFLEWLGRPDREAIVVGTTNVPDHLDEAFVRTGRFDYKVPFLYPGAAARLDVLRVHLGLKPGTKHAQPPLEGDPDRLVSFLEREIVPETRNFSCAELEELVTRAKRVAFNRGASAMGAADFEEAVASFRVNNEERAAAVEFYLDQARKMTDDRAFLLGLEAEVER